MIRSVLMNEKPSVNLRLPTAVLREMDALIDAGEYTNRTEFITRAVTDLLQREAMKEIVQVEVKRAMKKEG